MNYLTEFTYYLNASNKQVSMLTTKNYLADMRKFFSWVETTTHESFTITMLTPGLLQAYESYLLTNQTDATIPTSSTKRYLSSLRKFCEFLAEKEILTENPLQKREINEPGSFYKKQFANYLYLSKTSHITIKNYLIDIEQFFHWLKTVSSSKSQKQSDQELLQQISTPIIEEYKKRLLYDAHFSPASINRKLSALRKYFIFAKEQQLIPNKTVSIAQITTPSEKEAPISNKNTSMPSLNTKPQEYSSFPPFRLIQKLTKVCNFLISITIIIPIVKIMTELSYLFWKKTGGNVFVPATTSVNHKFPVRATNTSPFLLDNTLLNKHESFPEFKNLPKSFYAPYALSTKEFSLFHKILHAMRYKRPDWYQKYHSYSFVHYVHFGIVLIYASMLGFLLFHTWINKQHQEHPAIAGLATGPPRLIAFKGKINDTKNVPITEATNLRFSLYNDPTASGSSLMWQEVQNITPDNNGNFSTMLGYNNPLSQQLLQDNVKLYIGVTIGNNPELNPRQQIATVDYAHNAQQIQGLMPITSDNAGEKNVLLALDSSGNLTIGGKASPRFETTGGEMTLSGKTLTLTTGSETNSNVVINPDGKGIIDLQKPIQNTSQYGTSAELTGAVTIADTLGIVASSATQSALYINQNGTGDLISASSAGSAKFNLDSFGNGLFAGSVAIQGNKLTSTSTTFSLLDSNVINLLIGSNASAIYLGAHTGKTTINNNLDVKGSLTATKNISIGTANTQFSLNVEHANQEQAIARIFNTSTEAHADGLAIRLGNPSTENVSTDNHFINFETSGIGEVGSIRGNGSKGIQIVNGSFADWAEYFPKSLQETIPYGSLVCLGENGIATNCIDTQTTIVGIASEHPTVIAGENKGNASIAVGLTGIVKTRVNTENGAIKPGDLITVSSLAGVGMKATRTGFVVGRAMEAYDTSNPQKIGTIPVSIQMTWYNPTFAINNNGFLTLAIDDSQKNQEDLNIVSAIVNNILRGAQTLNASDNISRGSVVLADYIGTTVEHILTTEQLPFAQIAHLKTDLISPLASNSAIAAQFKHDRLNILNGNDQTASIVASIDNKGDAQFAGDVTAKNASFSGILRADKILANEIDGLDQKLATLAGNQVAATNSGSQQQELAKTETQKPSNDIAISLPPTYHLETTYATLSAEFAYTPHFATEFAQFNQGIVALGGSSLTDVAITGQLQLGQTTLIADNSINTIGANLELQPLRQGDISFMSGLVTIDTQGNLTVSGNATFAQNITVEGKLATKGIHIIRGVEADTSANESVSTGSAGTSIITAYHRERTIKTPYAQKDSLIYLTPTSDTQGLTPYIARQKSGSFTIQIPFSATKDIKVNWWIVN